MACCMKPDKRRWDFFQLYTFYFSLNKCESSASDNRETA